jgi:hypothetical protein
MRMAGSSAAMRSRASSPNTVVCSSASIGVTPRRYAF